MSEKNETDTKFEGSSTDVLLTKKHPEPVSEQSIGFLSKKEVKRGKRGRTDPRYFQSQTYPTCMGPRDTMYVFMSPFVCVCVCVCVCVFVYIYTYIILYLCMYIYIYICVYIYVCIYIYVYKCDLQVSGHGHR